MDAALSTLGPANGKRSKNSHLQLRTHLLSTNGSFVPPPNPRYIQNHSANRQKNPHSPHYRNGSALSVSSGSYDSLLNNSTNSSKTSINSAPPQGPSNFHHYSNEVAALEKQLNHLQLENARLKEKELQLAHAQRHLRSQFEHKIAQLNTNHTSFVNSLQKQTPPAAQSHLQEKIKLTTQLQLVSNELAQSVKRELALQTQLDASPTVNANSDYARLVFESELRNKSKTLIDLIDQLNTERIKRFTAEQQLLMISKDTN